MRSELPITLDTADVESAVILNLLSRDEIVKNVINKRYRQPKYQYRDSSDIGELIFKFRT